MTGQPETTSAHEILSEMLRELREINARLGVLTESATLSGAASSIQIEDRPTKDLAVRVTTKSYSGSPLDVDAAIEAHGRAHRLAEQHALDGWAETIDSELRRAVGAAPREAP